MRPYVWLVTFIAVSYPSQEALFEHAVNHYNHSLGVPKDRMLVAVNSDNATSSELNTHAHRISSRTGVPVDNMRIWAGTFDSHAKKNVKHSMTSVIPLDDWIIFSDNDELFWLSASSKRSVRADIAAENALRAGVFAVMGSFIDHATENGSLRDAKPPSKSNMSLFEQFPMQCDGVQRIGKGAVTKVMLMHGSVRSPAGNHFPYGRRAAREVIQSQGLLKTHDELVKASVIQAGSGNRSSTYGYFRNGWMKIESEEDAVKKPNSVSLTKPIAGVHHFKFTSAVRPMAAARLEVFKGRFPWWRESKRYLDALSDGKLDLDQAGCARPEHPIDA
jgi:hypothetical protein